VAGSVYPVVWRRAPPLPEPAPPRPGGRLAGAASCSRARQPVKRS